MGEFFQGGWSARCRRCLIERVAGFSRNTTDKSRLIWVMRRAFAFIGLGGKREGMSIRLGNVVEESAKSMESSWVFYASKGGRRQWRKLHFPCDVILTAVLVKLGLITEISSIFSILVFVHEKGIFYLSLSRSLFLKIVPYYVTPQLGQATNYRCTSS